MTSTQRWMTRREYTQLQNELAALRERHRVEVSGGFMDYDGNLFARHSARQARIGEIEELLTNAVVDGEPVGDPVAEAGMVLTIRYDATGETETFLLGRRHAEDATIKVYSAVSPLGCAIAGSRLGDQRIYAMPDQAGRLVTLLEAVPYWMHMPKHRGPQAVLPCQTGIRLRKNNTGAGKQRHQV